MKALIFDFDGLIIDTEWTWYQVYREVYREHGLDLPMELYARFLGTSGAALRHLIEQTGADSETVKKLLIDRHAAWAKHETLRPGVADYLKQAREMGLKIGLSSSSSRSWVKRYLEPHGLTGFFDVILTREDVTKVKPDPELYLKTIRHLGVSPGEAVAFEDSPNGARAAKDAGLVCVIVPHALSEQMEFPKIDLRIPSMANIPLRELLFRLSADMEKRNLISRDKG